MYSSLCLIREMEKDWELGCQEHVGAATNVLSMVHLYAQGHTFEGDKTPTTDTVLMVLPYDLSFDVRWLSGY